MMTRNPAMNCNEMAFFPANFMLQSLNHQQKEHPPTNLNSVLPSSSSSPQEFHGVCSLLGRRSLSFSGIDGCEDMNCEDDLSDDCSQAGEKKKRLNMEQVKTLEKNFELGNKLEPERKIQLARALGLQPRQIAIWFQNRRARWKTKKLEKDYDVLKRQFEAVKSDYEALQVQNKKLQAEILILKNRETSEPINLNKETEGSCSNRSENSSEIESRTNRSQANLTQFFQSCSRSDPLCPKIENQIHEESFCNLFGNLEEPTGFWTWTDQSNFH